MLRNLSTLDRSTDDEVKEGLRKLHKKRGHNGDAKFKVGKDKENKEASLQVDLEWLHNEFKGKKRGAGD